MNSLSKPNEHRLTSQLERIIGLYRNGIQVVTTCHSRQTLDSCIEQLRPLMKLIQDVEPNLKDEIESWPKHRLRNHPKLQILLKEQERVLKQFIDTLGTVQDALNLQKGKLAVQVDDASRFQNVSSAYQSQSMRDS